jgi:transcription elongation factor Elf1
MVQGMGISSFLASLQVIRAKPVTEHIFSSIKILTTTKKRIKSQNRNKKILNFLPKHIVYFYCIVSKVRVWQMREKQFTENSNLTRHMKTHVQSSQTYPCDVCGKKFKRADHRKRHEESHNYTITCPVCGQYFNAFVTHVLLKRYNRNIRYVWVKSSIFFYSCFEIWSSFLFVWCIYLVEWPLL